MRKLCLVAALLLALSVPVLANFDGLPNEINNGDFENGSYEGWEKTGGLSVFNQGDWAVAINPQGGNKWSGCVTSWGGDWNAPLGMMRQVIDESQFPGWNPNYNQKELLLEFDYFLQANMPNDPGRNVGLRIWLDWMDPDGSEYPVPSAPGYHRELLFEKWRDAGELAPGWEHESIYRLLPIQPRYLSIEVEYFAHYAEWSFIGIDNLDLKARCVPEPSSLAALSAGLLGLAGFIRRRR